MLDYDTLAAEYAQHRQIQPQVLKGILVTAGLTSTSRVLEIGCGAGNYIRKLANVVGCKCWGIDPSEQMLAQATERGGAVHYEMGRAERLPFPEASFDLVFSVDVIHHVIKRTAYFEAANRILRPGGRLCTVTDSESIIRNRQPLAVYFPATVEIELRRYPAISLLRTELSSAGFNQLREDNVVFPYPLTDCSAYKARAFSVLHMIEQEDFECGIARMEHDLTHGKIACISRYVLLWGTKTG